MAEPRPPIFYLQEQPTQYPSMPTSDKWFSPRDTISSTPRSLADIGRQWLGTTFNREGALLPHERLSPGIMQGYKYELGDGETIDDAGQVYDREGKALTFRPRSALAELAELGGNIAGGLGFGPKAAQGLVSAGGARRAARGAAAAADVEPPLQKLAKGVPEGVTFEETDPRNFTPSQWGRFGKQHGVPNLGPESDEAFSASLVPYKSVSGKDYTVPGGIDSQEPFTYYDLLHLKSQGINPNDLHPDVHQKIHDRIIKTMSPEGEVSPERLFNQLALAQISPNQPLTPNELALARVMAKGPEDLQSFANMIPWRHDDPAGRTEEAVAAAKKAISERYGIGKQSEGGLGVSGNADYTRLAETAQRIIQDPEFFRFRGTGEGGGTNARDWSNFVERLMNQTPGLGAKTGSFGSVWQNPAKADISAIDRHMAREFEGRMFDTPEARKAFEDNAVANYNKLAKKKGTEGVETWADMPDKARMEATFGVLNAHPSMKYRGQPARGSNSGEGMLNPRVPEHLSPDLAKWVQEPKTLEVISDMYRRLLDVNAERAGEAGQSIFASQWMLWDRIRNRLEPHEIMFPGLEKVPKMSMDQMRAVRKDLKDAGYFTYGKEIDPRSGDVKLQPVRPLPSASRAGYFTLPPLAAVGAYGAGSRPEDEPPVY